MRHSTLLILSQFNQLDVLLLWILYELIQQLLLTNSVLCVGKVIILSF